MDTEIRRFTSKFVGDFLFMAKKKKLKTIGKLKEEADRAMQDYFRTVKTHCEMCGQPYQVAHHYIFKSQSNYLRYEEKNLIWVCQKCHYKFHSNYAQSMVAKLIKQRGQEWSDWIEAHKRLLKSDNRVELVGLIQKFKV